MILSELCLNTAAAICWVSCATAFVIFNLVQPLDPYRTVEVGFTVCAAALSLLLYLLYRSPHPRAGDAIEPGSAQEVEAQLVAVDEIG